MNIAKYIDHTLLKPEATRKDVEKLCGEALEHGFYSVCINGCRVKYAAELLDPSDVKVCAVIGFPLGASTTKVKVMETRTAVSDGADEIDMVMNIGKFKDEEYEYVLEDIKAVVEEAHGKDALVKVILETCLLDNEEIVKACEICLEAGADFVKTSTGFNKEGATLEAVAVMKKTVGDKALVKAAGGVRNYQAAIDFINAGASRLGCSSSVAVVEGEEASGGY
ncbi:MAG TPA: deoxyribose-phosphate aldolase [Clostridia bacterium]|nr:deoxyribose-phosphate aldolase [Clostridia bacterium]HPQ47066.1 deoxyribose-phosphate aldolase [Clostridia bacterium]HRX41302.1 deoxyribose-phosphate aldolase [Clostridia bacterium]